MHAENTALKNNETRVREMNESTSPAFGKEELIYRQRFSQGEEVVRELSWKTIVPNFLQQYVRESDVVLDLGAGDGHFITNIKAKRRVAVDLSPHVLELESKGVEVLLHPATELSSVFQGKADVIFMSNFLEHLPSKQVLLQVLEECRKVLSDDGRLIILQPNIRYVGPAYWDYIDHHIALTEASLSEALDITGFKVNRLIPRFLPYTAKSKLGRICLLKIGQITLGELIVLTYLRMPFLWRIFGQQTFVVAGKNSHL